MLATDAAFGHIFRLCVFCFFTSTNEGGGEKPQLFDSPTLVHAVNV